VFSILDSTLLECITRGSIVSIEKGHKYFKCPYYKLVFGVASYKGELRIGALSLHKNGSSRKKAFKYRDRLMIFVDILSCAHSSRKGRTKTQILQGANLNYHQLTKYLSLLLENGYLERHNGGFYKVTAEGLQFAKILQSLNLRLT
jgi:predicted transcriptional regulator